MNVPRYLKGPCRLRWDGAGEMVAIIFDNGYRLVPVANEGEDEPVVNWLIVRERDRAWRLLGDRTWRKGR